MKESRTLSDLRHEYLNIGFDFQKNRSFLYKIPTTIWSQHMEDIHWMSFSAKKKSNFSVDATLERLFISSDNHDHTLHGAK